METCGPISKLAFENIKKIHLNIDILDNMLI